MRIAVLGTGNIGGTLGRKWAEAGHEVIFGVRDPGSPKARDFAANLPRQARVDTMANAAAAGEVVAFAIPGGAMQQAAQEYGQALNGKIVIDTTNNIGGPVVNSVGTLTAAAPRAQVYRAFNSLGWENFRDPVIAGVQADLFYCGPEPARQTVERLIADIGLRPVYVGGPDQAQVVDSILWLWFQLVRGRGLGRHLAFKLLSEQSV